MLIHDPAVFRLWSRLYQVAEQVTRVHIWRASDERKQLDQAFQHAVPTSVVCLDGVVRVSSGPRKHLDLHPGEMLVLAPGAWHRHEPLRPGSAAFAQGFLPGWSDIVLTTPSEHLHGGIPAQPCRRMIQELVDLGGEAKHEAERCRRAGELLAQVLSEQVHPPKPMHPALKRMAELVWFHARPGLTAAEVVAASGLGHSQAFAMFKAFFGVGPKQYLTNHRLNVALQLLREGKTIADAAEASGFTSRPDFTRAFRRRYQRPPRRWADIDELADPDQHSDSFAHQARFPRLTDPLTKI
jgi:AraC-like DNA-binding protein